MRFEEKYGLRFKTPYVHSLGGLIAFFALAAIIGLNPWQCAAAFGTHLLLDFPDRDKKQLLFPFSEKEFHGWLPIFSKTEIIFTGVLFFGFLIK